MMAGAAKLASELSRALDSCRALLIDDNGGSNENPELSYASACIMEA